MKREQRVGKHGEQLAASILRRMGVCQLERIGTPVRRVRDQLIYGDAVAADLRGILPGGKSVLAEVKTVEHNLRWSDFREHQPNKLSEHAALGGLSLVVWVHSSGVYIMSWPIDGFSPGTGLTPKQAKLAGWDG